MSLLGRFELLVDGVRIDDRRWGGRRGPAVVKLLALAPGHHLHREQLMDALWPTLPLDRAAPRVHKAVHLARGAMGHRESLVVSAERVSLWPSADLVVDVERFEEMALAARSSASPAAIAAAIGAYGGELLPDDLYEAWAAGSRDRLRLRYAELLRQAERWDDLVALDPTDEDAHLQLVQVSIGEGDRAGALRRLHTMESTLRRELDVRPGAAAERVRAEVLAMPVDDQSSALPEPADDPAATRRTGLPTPLSPFIGRSSELAALSTALAARRLVTVTGPGGVGKTRLAVAAGQRIRDVDGVEVMFVDLVKVVHDDLVSRARPRANERSGSVGAAIADAAGAPEHAGMDRLDTLIAALGDRRCLLLVDNCEHVQDAARVCIERVLVGCPEVRVLATSRIRLMLPFEHVVNVPGMSLDESTGRSDAVTLFVERMLAAGADPPSDDEHWRRIGAICRRLDGLALAIELAAGRVPGLGLDGLSLALDDRPDLLSVGTRAEDRHRSLSAAIAWSYDLLDDDDRAVLRAGAIFATPFDLDALCAVMRRPSTAVLACLARLIDWHLVTRGPGAVTRYRILEMIRQHATANAAAPELDDLHAAHRAWCAATLHDLRRRAPGDERWCGEVDAALPEAYAALAWGEARDRSSRGADFMELIADVVFQRGQPGEAQRRYAEAARSAGSPLERARLLRLAAGAAETSNVGDDAVELLHQSAEVWLGVAHHDDAAVDLARAAALQYRAVGIMRRPSTAEEIDALLEEARVTSRGGPRAEAAIAVAEGWAPDARPRSRTHTARALELAEHADEPLLVNEALDQLTALELYVLDLDAAAATIDRRLAVLRGVPVGPASGFELYDAFHMACHVNLAAGRLGAARRYADDVAALPFLREERHIGLGRRMEVDAIAGDFEAVTTRAALFESDWGRAGRPVAGNLAIGAYGAAMVFGMLGDPASRSHWTEIAGALLASSRRLQGPGNLWRAVFDAMLALHLGEPEAALDVLVRPPDAPVEDPNHLLWLPWYAALWAEASALTAQPDTADRLRRATAAAAGNEIALTIVERARQLLDGRLDGDALATWFESAHCPFQAARTRALAGAPVLRRRA